MAMTVLAIGIALAVAPILTSLDTLDDAQVNQIASNYAQGKIEEIRSLEYADVGFPGSTPVGVLSPSESVTLDGVAFTVTTDIEYVGSATGLNVVSGGGDGVPGSFNTGIDYKSATVTLTDDAGDHEPIIFRTIIAPPNLAAHEGFSNIIVNLSKYEPVGTPAPDVLHPLPLACIQLQDTLARTVSTGNDATQPFPLVTPNATNPSDPDYYYDIRLATTCELADPVTSWRIAPQSVSSTEVHVGPTSTADVSLELYLPATLTIEVLDSASAGITTGLSVSVSDGTTTEIFTEASGEFDAGTATFTITDFDGSPLVPGTYTIIADAAGYLQETRAGVSVPSGYPTVRQQDESFTLAGTGTTTTSSTASTTTTTTAPTGGDVVPIVNTGSGIAAIDSATGTGFIMYSSTDVHTRWASNPPWASGADHFVAVVYSGGQWYYDDNSTLRAFTPASDDLLVADVDFSANTSTELIGVQDTYQGIEKGYYAGDLDFIPEQWGGSYNAGEFDITGTSFTRWASGGGTTTTTTTTPTATGDVESIVNTGSGIAAQDGATGTGYILYSEQSVHTRFSANAPYYSQADHFIAVVYSGGWYYDNNWGLYPFTPASDDLIVADVDFGANTATVLTGIDSTVHGIRSGFHSGDLGIIPEQWAGSYNAGEFDISGTSFTRWAESAGSSTVQYSIHVEDWLDWAIHGATVTFDGAALSSPQTGTTDASGDVTIDVPDGTTLDLTISTMYGHETYAETIAISGSGSRDVNLQMPSGYGGIRYTDGAAAAYMGFGEENSAVLELEPVLLNASGNATVAVIGDGTTWDNSAFCPDDSVNFNQTRDVDYAGHVVTVDVDSYWNTGGC